MALNFDVCILGHVTRDLVVFGEDSPQMQAGGVSTYAAPIYRRLGLSTAVVTGAAGADKLALLSGLQASGASVFPIYGTTTTVFEHIYAEGENGPCVQRIAALAPPFRPENLGKISTRLWHLGPLTRRDIPAPLIRAVAKRGGRVALDAQGLVRSARRGVVKGLRPTDLSVLSHVAVLKANADEARLLTRLKDPIAAAKRLARKGPEEVIITLGAEGAVIAAGGEVHEIAAVPPRRLADPTGAGATWFAAYLARRLEGSEPAEAGRFAAVLASLKLARAGPFTGGAAALRAALGSG